MLTRLFPLATAALVLGACSPVSLTYTDMAESPDLKDALWVVQTVSFPESWGDLFEDSESEYFWVTDVRKACDDLQTFQQDYVDFLYGGAYTGLSQEELADPDTCEAYRGDLESLLDSRPDTTWELTVSMAVGGAIEDGAKDLGGVGGFDLSLLHYTADLTQSTLDYLGEDCQFDDDSDEMEDLTESLVGVEGEAVFTEDGTEAWDVSLDRVDLREPGDNDDEGMIEGDFSADLCEIAIVYPDLEDMR